MKNLIKILAIVIFIMIPVSASAQTFDRNLYFGMTNDSDVQMLQEFLTDQGIYSGPVTGNFYSLTLTAVKKFQAQNDINPAAGFFGPLTRAKANDILASQINASNQQAVQETGKTPSATQTTQTNDQQNTVGQSTVQNLQQQLTILQNQLNLLLQQQSSQNNNQQNNNQQNQTNAQQQVNQNQQNVLVQPNKCPTASSCDSNGNLIQLQSTPQPADPTPTITAWIDNTGLLNWTSKNANSCYWYYVDYSYLNGYGYIFIPINATSVHLGDYNIFNTNGYIKCGSRINATGSTATTTFSNQIPPVSAPVTTIPPPITTPKLTVNSTPLSSGYQSCSGGVCVPVYPNPHPASTNDSIAMFSFVNNPVRDITINAVTLKITGSKLTNLTNVWLMDNDTGSAWSYTPQNGITIDSTDSGISSIIFYPNYIISAGATKNIRVRIDSSKLTLTTASTVGAVLQVSIDNVNWSDGTNNNLTIGNLPIVGPTIRY